MNHATDARRPLALHTFVLGLATLSALAACVGCGCNLSNKPMLIMGPGGPGSGRVVGLHEIEPYDEPVDPSKMLRYPLIAIPPAIVELVEQARKERAEFAERHRAEQVVWGWRGLWLRDWGGRVAMMSLRPSEIMRDGRWVYRDPIFTESTVEYAVWIEREGAIAPPFWHRTSFRLPTNDARLTGVQHGYALFTIGRSRAPDIVFDLNTNPPTHITMPQHATLYAVSFRRDGSWAGLSSDTVFFGTTRNGAMQIERTIAITPPDDRRYTAGIWNFPSNADIYLSEDGQRALLHDFRIIARNGTITEAPEAAMAFRACGTPSRAGIMPARIGFVNPIPANERRSGSQVVRIDLNTLEYSIIRMRGMPRGGLEDVAPGFVAAGTYDRWEYCGIKGTSLRSVYEFDERGRFSRRRGHFPSSWPASGWYEEPTPQPNN